MKMYMYLGKNVKDVQVSTAQAEKWDITTARSLCILPVHIPLPHS